MNRRIPISLRLSDTFVSVGKPKATQHERPGPPQSLVDQAAADARANNYESICIPITNGKWRARWTRLCLKSNTESGDAMSGEGTMRTTEEIRLQERDAELWRAADGFRKDEVNLNKIEEAESVIGVISPWLELDSPDEWVRLDSELALRQELAYASYLNMQTVILPPPRNRQFVADYARAINACLPLISPYLQLSVRIPIQDPVATVDVGTLGQGSPFAAASGLFGERSASPVSSANGASTVGQDDANVHQSWEMWDLIRTVCGYSPRITLTLALIAPLSASSAALERWHAEPLRYLDVSATAFIPNSRGYPVLPKSAQLFIKDAIKHRPTVILTGTKSGIHRMGGELAYQQYIRFLEKHSPSVTALEDPESVESFAAGYWDYLQAPLQPLMDNLQSTTYEVFERDPVKYAQYEEAIYHALCDRPEDSRTVICVAGAGRGPLVANSLRAMRRSGRDAVLYAVEKNPCAFVTLQERKESEWGSQVNLVFGDMRTIVVPEQADILVSELLGSFGDNELSPECLDGAMRFLKPDGISIPSSYTAHLAPLSSSKLYNEANNSKDLKYSETPYVVIFQAVNNLSSEPQECWEFEHPRKDPVLDPNGLPYTNSHNTRSAHLTFQIPQAGVLHGLAGYFEACLYGDVGLSTHPRRKDHISPKMLSWFPIFFPFKDPLYLPANSELDVSIWRLTDKKKVWYEWFAESFFNLPTSAGASPRQIRRSSPSSENEDGLGLITRTAGNGTTVPPSPMVDAASENWEGRPRRGAPVGITQTSETRLKIGQTALHNPGGRSSWIGL